MKVTRRKEPVKSLLIACMGPFVGLMTGAIDDGLTERNPGDIKRQFKTKRRKRKNYVTEERLRLIWLQLKQKSEIKRQKSVLALQLFILTLQRPIDIARARREHFDFKALEWRIPWSPTKTEDPYVIPLSGPVMERVQEAFARNKLFPAKLTLSASTSTLGRRTRASGAP